MKQFVGGDCQKILDNIYHESHVRYWHVVLLFGIIVIYIGIACGPKFDWSDYVAAGGKLEDLNSDYSYHPMCFRQIELPNFDHYLPTSYQVFEQQDVNANIQEDAISLTVIATPIENDTIDKVIQLRHGVRKIPEYLDGF